MNTIIRKAKKDDAEQMIALRNLSARKGFAGFLSEDALVEEENREEERIAQIKKNIDDNSIISFVAEVDEKFVGFIDGKLLNPWGYFNKEGFSDLGQLYIHPEWQRQGLGRQLFDVFVSSLLKHGSEKMVIRVLERNTAARSLYEKLGGKLSDITQTNNYAGKLTNMVFYTFDLPELAKTKMRKFLK